MKRAMIGLIVLILSVSSVSAALTQPAISASIEGDLWEVGRDAYAICIDYSKPCRGSTTEFSMPKEFTLNFNTDEKSARTNGLSKEMSGEVKFSGMLWWKTPSQIIQGVTVAQRIGKGTIDSGGIIEIKEITSSAYCGEKDTTSMNNCYLGFAKLRKDDKACKKIDSEQLVGECQIEVAILKKSVNGCIRVKNLDSAREIHNCVYAGYNRETSSGQAFAFGDKYKLQDCCYFAVAQATKGPCTLIPNSDVQSDCVTKRYYQLAKQ